MIVRRKFTIQVKPFATTLCRRLLPNQIMYFSEVSFAKYIAVTAYIFLLPIPFSYRRVHSLCPTTVRVPAPYFVLVVSFRSIRHLFPKHTVHTVCTSTVHPVSTACTVPYVQYQSNTSTAQVYEYCIVQYRTVVEKHSIPGSILRDQFDSDEGDFVPVRTNCKGHSEEPVAEKTLTLTTQSTFFRARDKIVARGELLIMSILTWSTVGGETMHGREYYIQRQVAHHPTHITVVLHHAAVFTSRTVPVRNSESK